VVEFLVCWFWSTDYRTTLYQVQRLYKIETKTDRYGRWHRNDLGERSGGLLESSYSSEQCEKPRETLIMAVGLQIPEARYWLVKMLGVTVCVLHGHTPTEDGLPIRYDFSHAVASLVNAAWLWQLRYGRPSSVVREAKYAMKHSAVVACDVSTLMLRKQTNRGTGGSYIDRAIYAAIKWCLAWGKTTARNSEHSFSRRNNRKVGLNQYRYHFSQFNH
jgi:hypothetical protein